MGKQRKQYSAELKARVAIEAIKGSKTVNEMAARYEVHPNQVAMWKKLALDSMPGVFSNRRERDLKAEAELSDRLYQQIGQLKVELDWLKKKAGVFS